MLSSVKKHQTLMTLLSVTLATLCGIFIPGLFPPIKFIGTLFINLLKLFALPLIASSMLAILGGMSENLTQLKTLARKSMTYMVMSEIIAVSIALFLFNVFTPGKGVNSNILLRGAEMVQDTSTSHGEETLSITHFVTSIFPSNIVESMSHFDLMPVVIFSIMFGIGMAVVGERARALLNVVCAVRDVSMTCLHGVMLLSPIGIFVLVGVGIAEGSASGNLYQDFLALMSFVGIFMVGLILHALWQFLLVTLLTKKNPTTLIRTSLPMFSTAFATSSSVATLPVAMEVADKLHSKPLVTRFMLPLCASINTGGMMMYEVCAALFFTQVLGIDLSIPQQILLALACIMGGMAEGGIPESSMVSMVMVFKIVKVPLSALSILLPLDRILDRFRTVVNIFGNLCGVLVVNHFTKKGSD